MIKESTWQMLLYAISDGLTDKDACLLTGISRESFYKKKREDSDFSDMVKKAQVEFKKKHLDIISNAGKNSWQASAWLLERKFKPEFSKSDMHIIEQEDKYEEKSLEEIQAELDRFRKMEEDDKYQFKTDEELEEMWAKELDRLRKTYKRKQAS